jgi:mono/diheme cytochrome c family protein
VKNLFIFSQTINPPHSQEFSKSMKKKRGKSRVQFYLLPIVFLAFFLFEVGSMPEPQIRAAASAEEIAAGNFESGRDLFMGYAHFKREGPPCMGCHNVGKNGILGGGAMGPDLTNVSTRRTDTEIMEILSNTGAITPPMMQPIYADFPLTGEEQADLLAFMKASAGQPESDKEFLVIGISLAGFVAAILALGFVYRGRLRGVRKALVNKR